MKKVLVLIFALITMTTVLACCGTQDVFCDGFFCTDYFNTSIEVKFFVDKDNQVARQNIADATIKMKELLKLVDNAVSLSKASDLSNFNAADGGQTVPVSSITADIFDLAKELFVATDGFFNPAVFNLVDLWGFSARFSNANNTNMTMPYDRVIKESVPQQQYIDAFKELCNFEDIELVKNGNEYFLTKPTNIQSVDGVDYTLKIDFGGIAKGYACDKIKEIAAEYNLKNGYINIGTSSICFLDGANGKAVDVDIESPRLKDNQSTNTLLTLKNVQNSCVSVSGDYQRYFEVDGTRYCHIINPFSGYPQTTFASVVVNGDSAAVCDATTTALMLMPKDRAAVFCEQDTFESLGCRSSVFVSQQDNTLTVVSNADLKLIDAGAVMQTYNVYEGDVSFLTKRDNTSVWIGIGVFLCVVVLILLLSKRNSLINGQNEPKQKNFKELKFFNKYDLIVYVVVLVVIASSFFGAFWGNSKQDLKVVEIFVKDVLVYSFDCDTKIGKIKNSGWKQKILQKQDGDKLFVTVFADDEHTDFNVIMFDGNIAKVTEATCRGKDCTKQICTISRGNQIVLCMPHSLRVVGIGDGNLDIR